MAEKFKKNGVIFIFETYLGVGNILVKSFFSSLYHIINRTLLFINLVIKLFADVFVYFTFLTILVINFKIIRIILVVQ